MHYRGDFTFLYLPHLAQEAELMMKNLLVYLHHQQGDDILLYFIDTAKEEAQEDKWDRANNRIICITDEFMEEEEFDDIGLSGVQSFLKAQKNEMEEAGKTLQCPEAIDVSNQIEVIRK